jgi:hypothetical protein
MLSARLLLEPNRPSEAIDGFPTFAQAYVGRKRWAKPNDRVCSINWQPHGLILDRSISATICQAIT